MIKKFKKFKNSHNSNYIKEKEEKVEGAIEIFSEDIGTLNFDLSSISSDVEDIREEAEAEKFNF